MRPSQTLAADVHLQFHFVGLTRAESVVPTFFTPSTSPFPEPPDEMLFNINRFHAFVLVTWQFSIFFASQQIFPIFSNYVPQWRCDESEPFGKNCTSYLACRRPVQFENMAFHSAALEYDWVCGSRAYLASLFSQIQFAGVLCGTFLYGTLSDCLGRRPIALLALASGIAVSFVSGMAPSWQILLVTRFFIGLSIGGTIVVVCTFVMEMLLPEQRMALRAFFNWGVARLMVTVICYYFPDWREASIACAVAALPAFLIVLFVFPESPTWLHNKHRMEEMRRSERKIARIAGVPYVEVEHPKLEKKKGFLSLMKDGKLAKRLFVLWIISCSPFSSRFPKWFWSCLTRYAPTSVAETSTNTPKQSSAPASSS
uniref:MFS domain-containing protein n=1 Tax=Steinernema glaseri TaxID=37863 RepID=A0A1I7YLX4_9BILA